MDERMPRSPRPRGRRILAWTPAVAWATMIFAFSAQPDLRFIPDAGLDFVVRKLGHMVVFGILALLLWYALAATTTRRRPWIGALALTILYAISDELHQGGVTGRNASAADVGFDTLGALLAVAAVGIVRGRRARRRQARTEGHPRCTASRDALCSDREDPPPRRIGREEDEEGVT